jgi:glycerol-3-phosphate acyltransferase PlsX
MGNKICVAIDVMGGDHGPIETVLACTDFLIKYPKLNLLLVGDKKEIIYVLNSLPSKKLKKNNIEYGIKNSRLQILHTKHFIKMDESPSVALKKGKGSSIWLSVEAVKDGKCQAAVSAGNTGALMAISRYLLKTLKGIDRPAIASSLPNIKGKGTTVLDLGANVDCNENQLLQFAMMGSELVSAVDSIEKPTIGLLNIGEEVIKGNEIVKKTSALLKTSDLNFIGNVEGNDIFNGSTDVIVCDGFVGNVALKSSEGLAQMVRHFLKDEFNKNIFSKFLGLLSFPVLNTFSRRLDHRIYNGAALLGLNGIVYKSHGSADKFAFMHAIKRAADAAENNLNEKISAAIIRTK